MLRTLIRRHCQLGRWLLLALLTVPVSAEAQPGSIRKQAEFLGEGTAWVTPWFVHDGQDAGPVVLITGGMHGNEPAGSYAADQIRHWPIQKGRLIVVPRVNTLGLRAETRWFPPSRDEESQRDLNRNFPAAGRINAQGPVAEALWELVIEQQPDFVIDLHEGFDFHVSNPKSVGSSIIFSKSDRRNELAGKMIATVNSTIDCEDRQFELLSRSGAARGSLVRACTDELQIDSFILETTYRDQPLSLRARQHRLMVSTLMLELGLIHHDCVDVVSGNPEPGDIHVALYDAAGASANGINNVIRLLNRQSTIDVVRIGPSDLNPNLLQAFDVILFPGGSGGKQGRALGETGRSVVRDFVKQGGGIVGICAGAYLCSSHYDWSLHVINTAVFNRTIEIPGVGRKSMWYRGGSHQVKMELNDGAKSVLGQTGPVTVRYQNGPIISAGPSTSLPAYQPLAWFRSEVVRYEPQKGTMIDTPAIVCADFGKGRVLSISPHPEATPGLESIIANGIRWAAQRAPDH